MAVVNDIIYAIGGTNGSIPLNVNEAFDPSDNSWTTEAPMPTARSDCAVAVVNNEIYVIGGQIAEGFVGNNEVYNPQTNTWATVASMPTPRADLSACVVDGKIYLIGGKEYSNISPNYAETDINEVYDPSTNSWSTQAPMPSAVYGYAAAVVNGQIHIFGGLKSSVVIGKNVFVDANQVFDPQTETWSQDVNLPAAASYGAAVATTGFTAPIMGYFVGGYYANGFSDAVQVYNPDNDSWSPGAPMPTARGYLGVAIVDDIAYAIGGFDGQNYLDTVEKYTPIGYGTAPPQIYVSSPDNETYVEATLNYTINKPVTWIGYSLTMEANVSLIGQPMLLNATQGANNVVIFANDSLGNMGRSQTIYFSIDHIAPDISILDPENTSYGSSDIQLVFTVDKNVSEITYSLDGAANTTIQGNITLPALLNGGHKLTIYATDELGNEGFKTVYFDIAPFPTTTVVAVVVIVIIILLTGFLFFNRKRFEKKATGETPKNYDQKTLNKKPVIQEGSQN